MQQEDFAVLMKSNRGKIGAYEIGSEPKLDFMVKLERLSGVSISTLYQKLILEDEVNEKPAINEMDIIVSEPKVDYKSLPKKREPDDPLFGLAEKLEQLEHGLLHLKLELGKKEARIQELEVEVWKRKYKG